MAAFVFFDEFKLRLGDALIDLTTGGGHTFKFRLTNTTPNVDTHTDAASLTAITGGAYADLAITHAWGETSAGSGVYRFAASADPAWTASGTDFTTFRYVALFDDTHASDALVGYFDYGSGIVVPAGGTFTLNLDANFEIFTLDG